MGLSCFHNSLYSVYLRKQFSLGKLSYANDDKFNSCFFSRMRIEMESERGLIYYLLAAGSRVLHEV